MLALANLLTGFALAREGLEMEQQQPASPFAAAGAAKAQPSCVSTAEVSPSAVLLPSHWKAETGAALWEGTVLGKQLGAGVQVRHHHSGTPASPGQCLAPCPTNNALG